MVKFLRFSRSRNDGEQILAAASVNVADPNQRKKLQTIRVSNLATNANAWKWYDRLGELHFGVNRTARIAGHAHLVPKRRKADGTPGAIVKNSIVQSVYAGIWSPLGGERHLIESFIRLRKLQAHAHLIRNRTEGGEFNGYDWVSDDELLFDGDQVRRVTLPMTDGTSGNDRNSFSYEIRSEDYLGHVWTPHPRYSDLPDSAMTAVDDSCEQLYLLQQGIRAKLMSRLAMAGILYLPTEISEVTTGNRTADGKNDQSPFSTDPVLNSIVMSFIANKENHSDAIAAMPILIRGPAQFAEAIRHIILDREILEGDMALMDKALHRMLLGLDLQPTSVLGFQDSNHWDAWADRDEELRTHIMPELEAFCFAMEVLAIAPAIEEVAPGLSANVMTIADPSGATTRPNQAEDAKTASDRLAINSEGLRAMSGIPHEYAPSEEEFVRQAAVKAGNLYLATWGMKIHDQIDWDKAAAMGSSTPGPDATDPTGPSKKSNSTPDQGAPGNSESDTPKSKTPA